MGTTTPYSNNVENNSIFVKCQQINPVHLSLVQLVLAEHLAQPSNGTLAPTGGSAALHQQFFIKAVPFSSSRSPDRLVREQNVQPVPEHLEQQGPCTKQPWIIFTNRVPLIAMNYTCIFCIIKKSINFFFQNKS